MADIVKEYSNALYMLSAEESLESQFLGEIRIIKKIFDENKDFITLLSTPNIPKQQRMDTIDRVFDGQIHKHLCSFMKLMIRRCHAQYIPACFDEYEKLWYEKSGIMIADVVTAVPLTSVQKNALHKRLEEYTGKSVEMSCSVDESIIGGVSVTIGEKRLEGSIKSRLEALNDRIQTKTI